MNSLRLIVDGDEETIMKTIDYGKPGVLGFSVYLVVTTFFFLLFFLLVVTVESVWLLIPFGIFLIPFLINVYFIIPWTGVLFFYIMEKISNISRCLWVFTFCELTITTILDMAFLKDSKFLHGIKNLYNFTRFGCMSIYVLVNVVIKLAISWIPFVIGLVYFASVFPICFGIGCIVVLFQVGGVCILVVTTMIAVVANGQTQILKFILIAFGAIMGTGIGIIYCLVWGTIAPSATCSIASCTWMIFCCGCEIGFCGLHDFLCLGGLVSVFFADNALKKEKEVKVKRKSKDRFESLRRRAIEGGEELGEEGGDQEGVGEEEELENIIRVDQPLDEQPEQQVINQHMKTEVDDEAQPVMVESQEPPPLQPPLQQQQQQVSVVSFDVSNMSNVQVLGSIPIQPQPTIDDKSASSSSSSSSSSSEAEEEEEKDPEGDPVDEKNIEEEIDGIKLITIEDIKKNEDGEEEGADGKESSSSSSGGSGEEEPIFNTLNLE